MPLRSDGILPKALQELKHELQAAGQHIKHTVTNSCGARGLLAGCAPRQS